jgi:hypothetical protein
MAMTMSTTTPTVHMAPSKRSTISSANAAAIAARYTQEYRAPRRTQHSMPVDALAH